MSYFDQKTGDIVLTHEEKQELQGRKKLDVESLMNWIIWGNRKGTMVPHSVKEQLEREVEQEIGEGMWKVEQSRIGNYPPDMNSSRERELGIE
jgi:hypothetical protein